LADQAGEYVRLFGIDPRANQRVAPITIQRPDGKPVSGASVPAGTGFGRAVGQRPASGGSVNLSGDLAHQVRQLISQGYHIGAEHADVRRYRSGVWQTCAPITSNRESDVLASVSQCMAAYPNEYVRIFGIDPKAKRRGPEVTVQRPGQAPAPSAPVASYSAPQASVPATSSHGGGQGLSQDTAQQVNQFVNQGYRLSLEAADQRRYRSNVWKTCATLEGSRVSDLLAAIDGQLWAHQGEYVRLVAVDPKAKRRAAEITIQRP
jgi:carbon dioxide concentrating mechanism protein CcmM